MTVDTAGARTGRIAAFMYQAVFRRRRRILVFLLFMAGYLGIRLTGTDWQYRSSASLHVTTLDKYIFPGLDGNYSGTVSRNDAARDFMDEVEKLRSRSLAESVARDIGVEGLAGDGDFDSPFMTGARRLLIPFFPERKHSMEMDAGTRFPGGRIPDSAGGDPDFERAVRKVMRSTEIDADVRNRIIRITVTLDRPGRAREVLSRLIREYRESGRMEGMAPDSYDYLSRKADGLAGELARIDSELVRMKAGMGVLNARRPRPELEGEIRALHRDLAKNELAMITVLAHIETREKLLETRGKLSGGNRRSPPDSSRIASPPRRGSPGPDNPARPNDSEDFYRREKLNLAADYLSRVRLRADSLELRMKLDRIDARLRMTALLEDSIQRFTDKRSEVGRHFTRYSGNLAAARINHLLQPGRFPRARIVSPASFPEPVPFSRIRGTVLGMLFGILLSFGYALTAEWFYREMGANPRQTCRSPVIDPHRKAPRALYLPAGKTRAYESRPSGDAMHPGLTGVSPEESDFPDYAPGETTGSRPPI